MKRYLLSILILVAGLSFAVYENGVFFLALLDIPSFIIVVAVPLLFLNIMFGFKKTRRTFSIIRKNVNEQDTLLAALSFFKIYSIATWISAFIAIFTGSIGMLRNLDYKHFIGPNVALVLISLLYCNVIQLVVVMPYTVFIHKKLGNSKIRSDLLSIFGSIFGVISYLFLFLVIFICVL